MTPIDWNRRLDRAIDELAEELRDFRRRLHREPEPSGEERATTARVAERLAATGLRIRLCTGGRGLLADSPEIASMPRVAIRADLDALRLQDRKAVAYRSRHDGVMHACGHDAHTACVLGATLALDRLRQAGALPWPVDCRAVFQPAEETAEGAREMIEAGAVDGVFVIFALHVDPSRDLGRVGVREGAMTANCDWLDIEVEGRGGHAARPHESVDPIAAAAQLIGAIYAFIPRSLDSQEPVVVSVGQIEGGYSPNVIPDRVRMRGTMRSHDATARLRAQERIRQLARGLGEASGTTIRVVFGGGLAAVVNDPWATRVVREAAAGTLGPLAVETILRPSMGGEDFSGYLGRVPGAMFRLGVRSPHTGGQPLHSPLFDIDERALTMGAKILARAAVLACEPGRPESPREG